MATKSIGAASMGTAAPVFLVLSLICWVAMLGTIASWIGKEPVPGRATDRVMSQAYSGGFAVLLWIFLGALLLIASSKHAVPPWLGATAWIFHPLSGAAVVAAIVVLYTPERRWPVAVPAVLPVLIAAYVLYAFSPAVAIPVAKVGIAVWTVAIVLSISIIPETVRFARIHLDDGSIDATPGPKLDAWMAKQREKRRAEELDELRKFDDETKLYEVEHLIRADSPVLKEALEFMRHQPNRQAEAIQLLQSQQSSVLHYLADIDLQPTPQLCTAARGYLRQAVRERLTSTSTNTTKSPYIGAEFEEGVNAIRWISKNCGCDAELADIEAYAKSQDQEAPAVQKFLAALAEIRSEKK